MRSLALAAVLLSACGPRSFVRYDLDTEVEEDGSWTRTFVARGYRKVAEAPFAPDYARVSEVHCALLPPCPPRDGVEPPPELPACPAEESAPLRETLATEKCGATLERKTFRRTGSADTEIAPDFRRTRILHDSERVAGNAVTVRHIDLGVLTFYEYRETYKQWLTPADVIEAGRVALDIGLEFALEVLREELGTDYDVSRVELFLRQARAELAELIVIIAYTDLDFDAAEAELYRRMRQRGVAFDGETGKPDDARAAEWLDAHIAPLLVPKRKEAPRLTWADLSTEYYADYLDQKWKARRDELLAEDGPLRAQLHVLDNAFAETEFRPSVRLPGRLVDTDGAIGTDGAVSWRLDPERFEIEPRHIHALSVVPSPRFAKLYPQADTGGPGLARLADAAAGLSTEARAELAGFLAKKDIAGLDAWCGTERADAEPSDAVASTAAATRAETVRRVARRLGVDLPCGEDRSVAKK